MDLFLSDSHTGASLLGSYKTQSTVSSSRNRRRLKVGEETKSDFTRTLSGIASSLYLVNPGAPADRERMVLASSMPISSVYTYKYASISSEAPKWCPFNDPHLHEHIFSRLESAGLANRGKFVSVPITGAGELTGFKYSGGTTPQHLVFPVGSTEINWLTAVRGAAHLGEVAECARDVRYHMPDLDTNRGDATRRLRLWRSLNWIFEASREAGMIRYEPFSVGCALYSKDAERMDLKGGYERKMLYLGDHFCKESVLLSDISRGGRASDFWTIVEAVIMYKQKHKDDMVNEDEDVESSIPDEWYILLHQNMEKRNKGEPLARTIEAAINDTDLGEARKNRLKEFAASCMTNEQREMVFKGMGGSKMNTAALVNVADAVLANTAKRGVWIMMHTLLKQIRFNLLHLIGPKAHRILIMKMFMPALIALFLAQGGIGDSFVNGALTLEVIKNRVSKATIASMLSRSSDSSSNAPRHYAENDIASMNGRLNDCASIPLAFNVGRPIHDTVMNMREMDLIVNYTLNTSLAKQRLAASNRAAIRRRHKNRKAIDQAAILRQQQIEVSSEEEHEEEIEEEDMVEQSSGGEDGDEEVTEPSQQISRKRKALTSNANVPRPLKKGKLRSNIADLCIETIQNEDRQVSVESIQKLLTARQKRRHCNPEARKANGIAAMAAAVTDKKSFYETDEMAEAFIKYVMNFFDNVFKLRPGSLLNSIHSNRRTEKGAYDPPQAETTSDCICIEEGERHSPECLRQRDALAAESKIKTCPVDFNDETQVHERFLELITDPPSLNNVEDSMVVEQVFRNEQMLSSLLSNPVFTSILSAERGDLGRYIVLSNIVKFVNVLIACLVDGDMPLLAERRAKTSLERGKPRRRGCESVNSSISSFDYQKAGHCPSSGLRDRVLPKCISELKSIALERGRGGRAVLHRQTCGHMFCRLLKFFFFSLDSNKASLTDPASRGTLFKLDDICRDRDTYKELNWYRDLIHPIINGETYWVKSGEYTPATSESLENASTVDFLRLLKMAMLDEGVVPLPKEGVVSSITSASDLLKESIDCSCEAFRPQLFNETTVLTPTELIVPPVVEGVSITLQEEDEPEESNQTPVEIVIDELTDVDVTGVSAEILSLYDIFKNTTDMAPPEQDEPLVYLQEENDDDNTIPQPSDESIIDWLLSTL
uniref:Wsv037-like protein n=1 Tax=Chionoecetes opilio bacilliform virus TaxID=1825681 RepID=A0A1Q3DL16_9VIRU|nr:wsv037-like protein [Chionoecetes opilio bacilliform virus]GAV93161.1 hypothetical protein SCV_037 [Chionoecetes opilio bacilliform virus]